MISVNNVLIIQQWDSDERFAISKQFLTQINTGKYKAVFVITPQEYEMSWKNVTGSTVAEIEEGLAKTNTQMYIVYGSYGAMNIRRRSEPVINTTIIYMPMFWAYDVSSFDTGNEWTLFTDLPKPKINKLATSLSNKPHFHRCITMDYLEKQQLLDHMHYSWIETNDVYEFRYWDQKLTYLSDDYKTHLNSGSKPPIEVFESAFEIVMESCTHGVFFTEKTFNAIARGRPFLIIGIPGMNRLLEKFGFKTFYRELGLEELEQEFEHMHEPIQYTFDHDEYINRLINTLAENIMPYRYNPEVLYNKLKPATIHNRLRLKEIGSNRLFFPQLLKELQSKYNLTDEDLNLTPFINQ